MKFSAWLWRRPNRREQCQQTENVGYARAPGQV